VLFVAFVVRILVSGQWLPGIFRVFRAFRGHKNDMNKEATEYTDIEKLQTQVSAAR